MCPIARALAITMVAALAYTAPGNAQTPVPQTLRADIPSQALAQALEAFARQTGIQMFYESRFVRNRKTAGAPAGLEASEALARLLDGTALQFRFLNPRSVLILPAQGAAPQPQDTNLGPSLLSEEVLVTATKRETALAKLPMSVSVLSEKDLEASDIRGIEEIALRTPGVEYDSSSQFGPGTVTNLALRGLSSNTGQSTTALYIDDAPIHSWHIDTGFGNPYPITFDLARVEILRGPQGSLFGTGAEGGAIRFITNPPSVVTFDGLCQAEVSATERGEPSFQVAAAAGGPLIDGQLGGRISAWYRRDGGFVDRVDPFTLATVDENANSNATAMLRLGLAFTPREGLRVLPSFMYQSLDIRDSPNFYLDLSDPDAEILRNGKLLRQPATDRLALSALRVEEDFGATTLTSATSYLDRASLATVDQTNQAGTDFYGGYGNPLGPAYPSSYSDAVADVLGAHQVLFSQEIKLATREPEALSTWVVGVFYGHSRVSSTQDTYAVIAPQPPGLYSLESTGDTDLAAFGDGTISVSQRWRLSLGARVERTTTDSTGSQTGFANPVTVPFYHASGETGASLAPRFAVSYERGDGSFLYASASNGFRAGGLNVPECGAPPRYGPDSVWSYEGGIRQSFFSDRLQLASSLFHAQWSDIQQRISTTSSCFVNYTSNLGAAVSRGFDLTAEGLLAQRTRWSIDVGYLDAHYTKTISAAGNLVVEDGTVVGDLPAVPSPWNIALRAEYQKPLQAGAMGYLGLEEIVHSHNPGPFLEQNPAASSFNSTEFPDPATRLLNLHLGVMRGGLDLRLSLVNALNAHPLLQHDSDASGSTLQYAYTFRPRTVALRGTQRF